VIVGIVGLQILDDNDSGSGAAADSSSSTVAGVTTTAPIRQPNEVRVKVYNASGVLGVAQTTSDTLKAKGYNAQAPATLNSKRTGTAVQCRAGFEREGAELAANAIGNGATEEPFPKNPPAGADGADCLVIIGTA
jgi:hypothetical protein